MPESFFVLSKENLEIAVDEVISIAKIYDRFTKHKLISNLLIIQSNTNWKHMIKRASFVKEAGQILRKMSGLFLDEENFDILKNAKTFSCKVINLASQRFDPYELENSMGNMISKFSHAKVSLNNPDITIFLILSDKESFFGFAERVKQTKRPKKIESHPHELDWRLTRAMINLAGLRKGETVCDPFCGTGTTLIEAESMGIHAVGIDFDKKMCKKSQINVQENHFNSKIYNSDFSHVTKLERINGIVTDLPYGRSSKTSQKPEKVLQDFISILPKKKKIAVMCKKGFEEKLKFKPSKKYEIYRHKSLTRVILVK